MSVGVHGSSDAEPQSLADNNRLHKVGAPNPITDVLMAHRSP